MLIYWVKDKKKQPATTVAEIISMLQLGLIKEDCLSWHQGCETWVPLKDLPALRSYFSKEEPLPELTEQEAKELAEQQAKFEAELEEDEDEEEEEEKKIPEEEEKEKEAPAKGATVITLAPASSTERLLARLFDLSLYAAIYMSIIQWRGLPYQVELSFQNPLIWIFFIPLEAALLTYLGTTPGKAIMGIKVYPLLNIKPLPFRIALQRSLEVYIFGMGSMLLSLFPLSLFTMWFAKRRIEKKGFTFWDERLRTLPMQQKSAGVGRSLLVGGGILFLLLYTNIVQLPWLPAMMEEVENRSPETAEMIRKVAGDNPYLPENTQKTP